MRWAFAEINSREVSTPRTIRASISSKSTARSMTTPLPITGVQPEVRIPEGSR
jgi:hypothetical protein